MNNFIRENPGGIVLTGAGISVASGIPDFRSEDGLWKHYDPEEYGTLEAWQRQPNRVWEMFAAMLEVVQSAKPNPGHLALAELEKMGYVKAILTQNVDGLHQAAGSNNVLELHGSSQTLFCDHCGAETLTKTHQSAIKRGAFDECWCKDCEEYLRPKMVLFGEGLNETIIGEAEALAKEAPWILVVGTSAQVMPAALLPEICRSNGGKIFEINKEETALTFMAAGGGYGPQEELLPQLVEQL